ncbi:FAD-dependent oxidoreductase [Ochrobactrum sp. BD67]
MIIVGAGFYGCVLAVHLSGLGYRVLLSERAGEAMSRASAVNQARVHTGFHYPRSFVTALRSFHNRPRFIEDYSEALVSDFKMLYAIARHGTKVNAQRFYGMYKAMRAPIQEATPSQRAMFDADLIEDVFVCAEDAFDYTILRDSVFRRLEKTDVTIAFNCLGNSVSEQGDHLTVEFASGKKVQAARVFNVGYAQLNALLKSSGLKPLPLKHELVEIALVEPPPALRPFGVTVMDGAYFSSMPYPARKAYSLTHVRYTPHYHWTDETAPSSAYDMVGQLKTSTRWKHMVNDARRYMPVIDDVEWIESLYDVKTVPIKNEHDDGRPILLQHHDDMPGLWSVLGSKIDNIYDLLELVG